MTTIPRRIISPCREFGHFICFFLFTLLGILTFELHTTFISRHYCEGLFWWKITGFSQTAIAFGCRPQGLLSGI